MGGGTVVTTTDGGATWTQATIPLPVDGLASVSCPTTSDCVAVGASGSSGSGHVPAALYSTDGGATWSAATLPAGPGFLYSVSCPTAAVCVAVGSSTTVGIPAPPAAVVVSDDGGRSWTAGVASDLPVGLADVSCGSATDCVAEGVEFGPDGSETVVVTTSDGGMIWTPATVPPAQGAATVVSCPDATHCLMVGATGEGRLGTTATAAVSDDGGAVFTMATTGLRPSPGRWPLAPPRSRVGRHRTAWPWV